MSTRRNSPSQTAQVQELQKELTTLRQAALAASADGNNMQATSSGRFEAAQAFEALTPTEQAAASLGAQTAFVGMFDELDEGTQLFKVSAAPPREGSARQTAAFPRGVGARRAGPNSSSRRAGA